MTTLLFIVAALILLAIPTAAWVDAVGKLDDLLTENVDLLFKASGLESAVRALEAENADLHLLLTEREIASGVVHVPLLRSCDRVMPMHPTPDGVCVTCGGEHPAPCPLSVERPDLSIVPVADGDFPIHTAVDDDELTAVMRATEDES